jgi:hypothetical protein
MNASTGFEHFEVSPRVRISALWTALLFIFAYVDLFSLYRPDIRTDLDAGRLSGITVDQTFLLATTIYIIIPSLMVVGALVLRPRINRVVNIALSATYAVTIVATAIGAWNYYLLASAIEVALLASIAYCAWTWPRTVPSSGSATVTTRGSLGSSAPPGRELRDLVEGPVKLNT